MEDKFFEEDKSIFGDDDVFDLSPMVWMFF